LSPATEPLACERQGAGEAVVFVHGFTQTGRSWWRVVADLVAHYEVATVDLPDHGASFERHPSDLVDAAAMLAATIGRATYVGYSLGGRLCLTLALERPELVERLVLVGATAGIADDAERAARRRADEALAERLDPADSGKGLGLEQFLDEWLAGPLFAHLSPAEADRASRRTNTSAGLARSLRTVGTGTQTPSYARLGELQMPVLVVAGEKDLKFAASAHEMAAGIGPNASVAIVPGASHAVPFEAPARFLSTLSDWLAATASR
jgi:2-succinyl-6-hydroxy-2,4-cyclohexadiene-1-carboxylate synthase